MAALDKQDGKRNWKSYFWEFIMLFLAVFCGFLAENIREDYNEHQSAKEFAKSLVQDFQNDTASLYEYQQTAKKFVVLSDSLFACSKRKLEGRNAAKFSFYTRFMYWTARVSWNRATFEQLKNSGSLRYFENYKLLEKLMKYDALVNQIEGDLSNHHTRNNLLLNSINEIIDPDFHRKFSRLGITSLDTLSTASREQYFSTYTESLETKRERIREMLNMVVVQQRNLNYNIDGRLEPAKELANELIHELTKEYNLK